MNNYKKLWIGAMIIVLLLGLMFFVDYDFSTIGQFDNEVECVFNESNGGSCLLELELPQYRSVESYTLDFSFDKYAHPDEYGKQVVTPFSSVGDLYEEGNTDESSSYEDLEHNWIYLFRMPSEWEESEIEIVRMEAFSPNAYGLKRKPSSDIVLKMYNGHIEIPYIRTTAPICRESRTSDCPVDMLFKWRDDNSGERSFNFYNDLASEIISYNSLYLTSSKEVDMPTTIDLTKVSELNIRDISNIEDYTDLKSQLVFYNRIMVDEMEKGYTDYRITLPPTITLSYKKSFYPTNVEYGFGSQMKILSGEQTDTITTQDLTQQIINECSRQNNSDTCVLTLEITSESPGKIYVNNEVAKITVISTGTNNEREDSKPNMITAWVVGVQNNKEDIFLFGSLAVIILGSLIGAYFIYRGKKQ